MRLASPPRLAIASRPALRWPTLLAFACAFLALSEMRAADPLPGKSFDIPADAAVRSLKRFSEQAGVQVIFPSHVASGIRTRAIKGEMTPREAIETMLAETGLVPIQDDQTKAFAVRRETKDESKNDERAAPTVASDRPRQNREAPAAAESSLDGDKPVELTPFTVSASDDVGYMARNTLAGTRLDTSLNDLASQISVMTPEFLSDVAATSLEDAFRYAMNVDTLEDFSATTAGGGTMDQAIFNDGRRFRTRGLSQSTLMQDLFQTRVRSDVYNTERFTLASGPNAILFGLGSPAGVAETSLKRARVSGSIGAELGLRVDSEESMRASLDINVPIVKDRLAVRMVALRSDANMLPAPSSRLDSRIFSTLTFQPFKRTQLRISYEDVRLDEYPARPILVRDAITPWLSAGKPLFDNSGITAASPASVTQSRINAAGLGNIFGRYGNQEFMFTVGQTRDGAVSAPARWVGTVATRGPEATRTAPDNQIGSLLDPTVFPLDVNYGGNGQRNLTSAWTARAILEQSFYDKVFLQAGYNTEKWSQRIQSAQMGVATLGADANMYLPDGITPNPNVGRYYFQNTGRWRGSRWFTDREDWRLSLATILDLEKRNQWLGRHRVMGLLTREEARTGDQGYQMRIVTPSPTAAAAGLQAGRPGDLNVASIPPRVYVDDPRDPNSRGVYWINLPFDSFEAYTLPDGTTIDSWGHPTGSDAGSVGKNRTDSAVLALQDYWLRGRIVTTLGWRKDRDRSINYGLPFGQFMPPVEQVAIGDFVNDNRGGTRNLGIVAHPFKWLSFHYGESMTFAPGVQGQDPYGNIIPGSHGEGEDYGFSIKLLGDRMYLRVNFYENTAGPTQSAFHSGVFSPIQQIELSLRRAGVPAHPTLRFGEDSENGIPYRVVSNQRSEGAEVELTGNPTPQWRMAISVAKAEAKESEIGVPWVGIVKELGPRWAQNAALPLWNDATRTVGEMFQPLVNSLNLMQRSDGTKVESAREWRVRLTTRYSFRESWLKNSFVGGSFLWNSANVVGYRRTEVPNEYPDLGIVGGKVVVSDITQPYQGNPLTALDAFAGYSRKLFRGKIGWRVQLNIRNLFDDDDLVIRDVYSDGSLRQVNLPQPRLFILTNTFSY